MSAMDPSSPAADATGMKRKRSETASTTTKRTRTSPASAKQTLRQLPPLRRCFWKPNATAQVSQHVFDRNTSGLQRRLPDNETAVLALNEIAACHGYGRFWYLPSREVWKTFEGEPLLPAERVAGPPGAAYPSILYLPYSWTSTTQQEYYHEPQRSRYLKSNGLVRPPADTAPLYAIQYSGFGRCPLYATESDTLILLATTAFFYLATTSRLEVINGRWRTAAKRSAPRGPDPERRLKSMPWLWDESKLDAPASAKLAELNNDRYEDLESVYWEIIRLCRPVSGGVASTLTAADLLSLIPISQTASSVGRPLGIALEAFPSSEPPSRRGATIQRRRGLISGDISHEARFSGSFTRGALSGSGDHNGTIGPSNDTNEE